MALSWTRRDGASPGWDNDTVSISTPSHQSESVSLEWGQTWATSRRLCLLAASRRVIPVVRRVLADELSAVGVTVSSLMATTAVSSSSLPGTAAPGDDGRSSAHPAPGLSLPAMVMPGGWVRTAAGATERIVPGGRALCAGAACRPCNRGASSHDGCTCRFARMGIISEWEPTLGRLAPKEPTLPMQCFVLATEVAAIDHATGSVYLMAIAWNLNGLDEGVDGAYGLCG